MFFFFFYITLSLNLPRSLWFDLGTLRIILLRSPALGSEKAILEPLRRSCYVIKGNLWEQSTTGGNSFISNFVPFFSLFFKKIFLFLLYCAFIVATKRGILENFETHFGNLLDTPLPSPSSSIMDSETHNNHDENRRTMYELLNFVFPNNIKYQKI